MLGAGSIDSVRGLATAGGHHTTAGAAAAPAGSSDDDSARALALLGEGLTRAQIAHRMGVRLDLLNRTLRAAGVDPDTVPRSPVAEILRLRGEEGRRDPDIAERLGMHALEVWRVRRQHRVPAVVGPLKPEDAKAKHRAENRAIKATPKISDGASFSDRIRGEYDRFVAALLGPERFADDPRADRVGRPVVVTPRSSAHSGASSAMAWF